MAKPGAPSFDPQQVLAEAVTLHRQGRLDEEGEHTAGKVAEGKGWPGNR